MGRKSRRSFLTQEETIKYTDESKKNESVCVDLEYPQVKQGIENQTQNKSSTSAKKKRRKRQKKKYKEKKRSQIQIVIMHPSKHEDNGNHNSSPLNSFGEDVGKRQMFDGENDIIMCSSDDEKSNHTIKTSNESNMNDEYMEFEHFSTIQRNRNNKKDLQRESFTFQENSFFNERSINQYKKRISSDCFNHVLWNKQKQIHYTWLNEVLWIGKNHVAEHILLKSGVEHDKSTSKIKSNTHFNSKYDSDHNESGNRKNDLTFEKYDPKNHNFCDENKSKKRLSQHIYYRASHCDKSNKYNDNSCNKSEYCVPKSKEIFALSLKLHQIKTRLWPAAIECAKILGKNKNIDENVQSNQIKATVAFNKETNSEQITSEKTQGYCTSTTPAKEFEKARRACNPFEELGEGRKGGLNNLFLNRSAMKLVNIDAMLNFSLVQSNSISSNTRLESSDEYNLSELPIASEPIIPKTTPFRFVDLCGAPGGFTEYILYQCNRQEIPVQGWGLSLIGENKNGPGLDWKLHSHKKWQNSFKISFGADGTGDILEWTNVDAFMKEICHDCIHSYEEWYPASQNTYNVENHMEKNMEINYFTKYTQHIDLVVADGGCQAQRDNSQQEELTLPMVVTEIAVALSLLKIGGKLIVKMFGFQSAPIKSTMRHLWESFEKISVMKPILSRPASAERYLVCFGYKGVQENWNGLTWRDNVLDLKDDICTDQVKTLRCSDEMEAYEVLENYLSSIDRDILELNIKACFGILSQLESKSQKTSNRNQYMPPKSTLNIDMYREAWKLT